MSYDYKQYGNIVRNYFGSTVILLLAVGTWDWFSRFHSVALSCIAFWGFAMALSSHYLWVRDGGDHLSIRFGPFWLWWPVLIHYRNITRVEFSERSRPYFRHWTGKAYTPLVGWTYRIAPDQWCVIVRTRRRRYRIFT